MVLLILEIPCPLEDSGVIFDYLVLSEEERIRGMMSVISIGDR
jgi:hypothetical protein